jgi:tetratricopeptide (TPR) repeat protein
MLEASLQRPVWVDDPVLERIYDHFEANLQAVIRAGAAGGARVLVCSVVSNLKDCAPFLARDGAAGTRAPASPRPATEPASGVFATGEAAPGGTLAKLEQSVAEQAGNASLRFRLGQALLARGGTNEARQHFEAARDLDGFRARSDSRLNGIIRRVTAAREGVGVRLVDAEAALAAASPGGVTGDELLCDHVHFRFEGNYWLARLLAETIASDLSPPAPPSLGWLSLEECARRLALTDWARGSFVRAIHRQLAGPLFQRQSNHAEREARLRRELQALEPAMRPDAFPRQAQVLQEAIRQAPRDWMLHDQRGKFLFGWGDRAGAREAWSNVVELVPTFFMGQYQLGLLLNQPETAREAELHLRAALGLRPHSPEVCVALGTARSHQQDFLSADRFFGRALALDPSHEASQIAWAESWAARGQMPEARRRLEQVLARNSNSLPAHLQLGRLLARQGLGGEAVAQFREVLRLDPQNRAARAYLAAPEAREGEGP